MPGDQSDQTYASGNAYTRASLPEDLRNPDGVYSGMARRNAYEDGEFVPGTLDGRSIKDRDGDGPPKRVRKR